MVEHSRITFREFVRVQHLIKVMSNSLRRSFGGKKAHDKDCAKGVEFRANADLSTTDAGEHQRTHRKTGFSLTHLYEWM